jgi:hypothetical protein
MSVAGGEGGKSGFRIDPGPWRQTDAIKIRFNVYDFKRMLDQSDYKDDFEAVISPDTKFSSLFSLLYKAGVKTRSGNRIEVQAVLATIDFGIRDRAGEPPRFSTIQLLTLDFIKNLLRESKDQANDLGLGNLNPQDAKLAIDELDKVINDVFTRISRGQLKKPPLIPWSVIVLNLADEYRARVSPSTITSLENLFYSSEGILRSLFSMIEEKAGNKLKEKPKSGMFAKLLQGLPETYAECQGRLTNEQTVIIAAASSGAPTASND